MANLYYKQPSSMFQQDGTGFAVNAAAAFPEQQWPSASYPPHQHQHQHQHQWAYGLTNDPNSVWAMAPPAMPSASMQPHRALKDGPAMFYPPMEAPPAVGWGGQAIGQPRNKSSRGGARRGNGGGNKSGRGDRRANDKQDTTRYGGKWNSGGGGSGYESGGGSRGSSGSNSWDDRMAVEEIMRLFQMTHVPSKAHKGRHTQLPPIPQAVFDMVETFDGRRLAFLLKEMAGNGLALRAMQLFDTLQGMAGTHQLGRLCDTYSYTGMVSVCILQKDVQRAVALVAEMKLRGIECSVHTYTALMNVAIKSNQGQVALDAYAMMLQDGLQPNVITFNTLVDVYGKMGSWEQAVGVLQVMREMGVQPVLRTYNTLMIACNICAQPREALRLYNIMIGEGFSPNATTYNTLITAHGKVGQLDRAMEAFQEMRSKGYPRSVVTYSTLISACERVGQWRRALDLFAEMRPDGCAPNTVTYNSLIKACAQGGQWEKALELFEAMGSEGCRPDVVTFTALINSVKSDKGGQWRMALEIFGRMRSCGCKPDSIVYNAIIDCLWETGVVAAQCEALVVFHRAQKDGHFRHRGLVELACNGGDMPRLEVNLHAQTAGVAMLGLFSWLVALRQHVDDAGGQAKPQLPAVLAVVTDGSGRGAREMANNVVKGAVVNMMQAWDSPFRPSVDSVNCRLLEASGPAVKQWLLSPEFDAQLPVFFPCAHYGSMPGGTKKLDVAEPRCSEAFAAIKNFEQTHALNLQSMGLPYLEARPELINFAVEVGGRLGLAKEVVHDAVLLMDRAASTVYTQLQSDQMALTMASCIRVTARRLLEAGTGNCLHMEDADFETATGMKSEALYQSELELFRILNNDTASISAMRCIQVYLERMGCDFKDPQSMELMLTVPSQLVAEGLSDASFLNCRPSIVAAGILYTSRRACGMVPYWPSVLAKMTGYRDMNAPEITVAVKTSQRVYSKVIGQVIRRTSSQAGDTAASPVRGSSPVMWSSSTSNSLGSSPIFPASANGSFSDGGHHHMLNASSLAKINSLGTALSRQLSHSGNSLNLLSVSSPPRVNSPPGSLSPTGGQSPTAGHCLPQGVPFVSTSTGGDSPRGMFSMVDLDLGALTLGPLV